MQPLNRYFNDFDFLDSKRAKQIRSYLPPLNFITVHYFYFIVTCLITSVIFWGASDPARSISYTDSLFLVVSAMTEAGLNTVNLSEMTTFQQVILWLLIVIGSSIFVSISTILTRKRVFESRFKHIVKLQKEARRTHRRSMSNPRRRDSATNILGLTEKAVKVANMSDLGTPNKMPRDFTPIPSENGLAVIEAKPAEPAVDAGTSENNGSTPIDALNPLEELGMTHNPDHIGFMRYAPSPEGTPKPEHSRVLSFAGVGAHPNATGYRSFSPSSDGGIYNRGRKKDVTPSEAEQLSHAEYPHYLTRHTTGRNAQFFGLSKAEREHLGGVEYRAITLLAYVVPIYFVLWQLFGCIGLSAYMAHNKTNVSRDNGINPWWLGVFNAVSAFNNSGMSLLDANMIPFQTSVYTVITMGLLILAGNTAYPLFLRLIFWSFLKLLCWIYPSDDQYKDHKATLRFILTYPRRVYTNLFPSTATWWLLFMVTLLNGIDWAAFELLNIGNSAVTAIPKRFRVLDGLFQALAVRSGGFYIISISALRIGLQVLYVIMMYISVYPVVITMRHSNVYEERSLGIYADDSAPKEDLESGGPKLGTLANRLRKTITTTFSYPYPSAPVAQDGTGTHFIRQQIRGQLAHDLWWLVLATLFISCIEVSNFERDPVTYSVFNIMFEVISGYGSVGISTGLPNEAYSFSGGWHVSSKLILCAVMLRGRHRGLPVALDRAVRLPHEGELGRLEEEDMQVRRSMSFAPGERRRFENSNSRFGTPLFGSPRVGVDAG